MIATLRRPGIVVCWVRKHRAATRPAVGRRPDHPARRLDRAGRGERDDTRPARLHRVSRPPRLGRKGNPETTPNSGIERAAASVRRPSTSAGNGSRRGGATAQHTPMPTIALCSGSIESWRAPPARAAPKSVLMSVRLPRSEVR